MPIRSSPATRGKKAARKGVNPRAANLSCPKTKTGRSFLILLLKAKTSWNRRKHLRIATKR
jgi:hypothetical protein